MKITLEYEGVCSLEGKLNIKRNRMIIKTMLNGGAIFFLHVDFPDPVGGDSLGGTRIYKLFCCQCDLCFKVSFDS